MRKKSAIFILMSVIAFASAAAVVVFLVYTLMLRMNYRADVMDINQSFLKKGTVTVSRGEESFTFPAEELEYYDKFLLDRNTTVFSRRSVPETKDTIVLDFGKETLSFTGLEDGSAIAICWKTQEHEKNYIVRTALTFMQLSAYYTNCRRKADSEE